MDAILVKLARHGLWIVFGNVFLEQIGAPIPALPTLIVAGALAADGTLGLLLCSARPWRGRSWRTRPGS